MNRHLFILFFLGLLGSLYAQDYDLQKRIKAKEAETAFYARGGRNFRTVIGGFGSIMSSPEQDCNSALPVCQLTYTQSNSYSGEGNTQEIPGNSSCLGSNEKNSVWYIFTVTAAGTLDFDITPNNMNDDYDFALYNITGSNCNGIKSGAITPVRCNFSATSGVTGLDPSASNPSEPASGPKNSTTLPVTVGQTYVLVISNYSSTQNGYSLNFTPSSASIFDVTPPTPQTVTAPCGSTTITLNTSEAIKCSSISSGGSEFSVTGTGGPYTVTSATGINCGSATPQISITVSPALSGTGPWTLQIASGSDGNSLIDNCGNAMANTSFNFNQTPTVASISGDNSICSGETVGLTASNGSSWSWSGPNIIGSTTSQTISISPTSNATYNVTVSNGSCGTSNASFSVSVAQSPVAAFTVSPITVCAGSPVTFTNTTQLPPTCGGLGLSQCTTIGASCGFFQTCQATGPFTTGATPTYLWTFGDGGTDFYLAGNGTQNPIHTYTNPGTYTVTLNASSIVGACSNTVSQTVNVLPGSTPIVASNDTTICGGSANLSASGGSSYTWTANGSNVGTGSTISVSPSATTTYTVTSPGCNGNLTDFVTVNVTGSGGSVTLNTTNASICSGNSVSLIASGASSYSWSPSAGLSSTSGASVTASPNTTTTYTVTGNPASCPITNVVTITVNNPPNVTVNPASSSVCPNQPVNLTASGATTYTWIPSSGLNTNSGSTVIANVTVATTYTVIGTSNGCSDTAFAQINLNAPISLNITPSNASVCPGESVNLSASGATTYSWFPPIDLNNTNSANVTSTPTSTITYTVIGVSGTCTDTANVLVSVVNNLTVSVTPTSDTICTGNSTTLSASGASNFSWFPATGINSSTSPNVTASPSSTITYTVIGSSGSCSDTSTVMVTVVGPPQVQITPVQSTICPGSSTNLTASGASSYSWSPATALNNNNTANVTASPLSNISYTVTGTTNGCSDTAIAEVIVTNNVSINVNPSTATVCPGGTAALTASGALNYSWFPSANLSTSTGSSTTATPLNSTTYTVVGSTGTCADTATVTITVSNNISISADNNPDSVCVGQSTTVTMNGANTYTWFPQTNTSVINSSSFSANPPVSTQYTIIGANGTCRDTILHSVFIKPLPQVLVNPSNITICPGSSILLTASGASSYSWAPTAGLSTTIGSNIVASPSTSTFYTVRGTSNGCSDTTIIRINVTILPPLNLTAVKTIICQGQTTSLNASGFNDYTWSPAPQSFNLDSSSVVVAPTVTTNYSVTGIIGGCSVTKSLQITVTPIPAVTVNGPPDSVCYRQNINLSASGATTYFWYPSNVFTVNTGSSVSTIPISNTTYTCIGSTTGCNDTALITVLVKPPVVISAFPDTAICPGGAVVLSASGGTSYSWSSGQTSQQITVRPKTETYYYVYGYNGNCFNIDSALVDLLPVPRADFDFDFNPVNSYNQNAQIIDLSSGATDYFYFSGDPSIDTVYNTPAPLITYFTDNGDTFMVKQVVVNEFGCSDSTEKKFIIAPEYALYLPNAFTPNEQGGNEKFGAKGFGIKEYTLLVFDRWGNQLYKTGSLSEGWDGKVGGRPQVMDTYVWKVIFKAFDNRERTLEGQFNLIR
jgi:gliding motility-associated-like protein